MRVLRPFLLLPILFFLFIGKGSDFPWISGNTPALNRTYKVVKPFEFVDGDILYRVNAGGPFVPNKDGGPDWTEDTAANPSAYLTEAGNNNTFAGQIDFYDASVDLTEVPEAIFDHERYDTGEGTPNITYSFPVSTAGNYEVRLYVGEGFLTNEGDRVFDVLIEGNPYPELTNLDLIKKFQANTGGMISHTIPVNDGSLDIEFLHGIEENPQLNGIEIIDRTSSEAPIYVHPINDQTSNTGQQSTGEANVQAYGGDGALTYDFQGLPPGLIGNTSTGEITGIIDPGADAGSPYTVTVTVDDTDASNADEVIKTFTWTVIKAFAFRINAGGAETASQDIFRYWEDNTQEGAQSGGNYNVNTGLIYDTPTPALYTNRDISIPAYIDQTTFGELFAEERFDVPTGAEMTFEMPLGNGTYAVNFFLANSFSGTSNPGDRIFHLTLEGQVVEPNLDLVTRFGHQVGGMISYQVNVTDGTLDIGFLHQVENPLINSIEVFSIDTSNPVLTLQNPGDQLNSAGQDVTLDLEEGGGDPGEAYAFYMVDGPPGLTIDENTGVISGTVDVGAETGGPNKDGIYITRVSVMKPGSAPVNHVFNWTIVDNQAPVAVADATPLQGAAPLDVSFTGDGSSDDKDALNELTFDWDFGDSNSGTGMDVSHTYDTPGTYTATLTVTDSDGASSTATVTIVVDQGPTADIQTDVTQGAAPLTVNFMGDGSTDDGTITNYDWDFGTGDTSTDVNPTYVFDTPGTYTVALTVTDDDGYTDTVTVEITVDQGPTALAEADVTAGPAPLDVQFTGSNSSDDTGIATYAWDFGNGDSSTLADPTYTFNTAGTYTVTLVVTDEDGYTAQDTITITVGSPPTALAEADVTAGPAPLDVQFTGSNSSDDTGIATYNWDFGNGDTSTLADPLYSFDTPGTYTVTLTVTDDDGYTDTDTIEIIVDEGPTALAEADVTAGPAPLDVKFTGSNSTDDTGIAAYHWDFGNGDTSTLADPPYTFDTPGAYIVTLTVTDDDGYTGQDTITITVGNPPTALAEADVTTGPAPLDVQFTGSNSTDDTGIATYNWDFGNGDTSTLADPGYTFDTPGTYTVTLTVTDDDGYTGQDTITITVGNPPTAIAEADLTAGPAPLDVQFTGSNSTDDNGIATYQWDFGNGDTSTIADPAYTFDTPGTYTVTLTVTDDDGYTGQDTITITVGNPPTAIAEANVTAGPAPLDVQFTGSNSTDDTGIATYDWDFGNGDTSTLADPTYTFDTQGTYTVTLTVTDDDGYTGQDTIIITVGNPPMAVAEADVTNGAAPLDVQFTGSNSADDTGIVAYAWDFGNGDTSTLADPSYTFNTPGTYTVTLTVTDDDGYTDQATLTITVGNPPNAVASSDVTEGPPPLTVNFSSEGSSAEEGIVTYHWDFGDGITSQLQNPEYTYGQPGVYEVILTITDTQGYEDTDTLEIIVGDPPNAVAEASVTEGFAPLQIDFDGSNSSSSNGDLTYEWRLEDGTVLGTGATISYTLNDAGSYVVILTVTDTKGYSDEDEVVITVNEATDEPPVAIAEATPTSGTAPLVVEFTGSGSTDDKAIVSYEWDFGDGSSSQEADPTHTYITPGIYTVSLVVTDSSGQEDLATLSIEVVSGNETEGPTAVIVADKTRGPAPLLVEFKGDQSKDDYGIVDFHWDFGDGNTTNYINTAHNFTEPGTYEVTLTVTDHEGQTDSAVQVILVGEEEAPLEAMLMENPVQNSLIRVRLINEPVDHELILIYLRDLRGRIIYSYVPSEVEGNLNTFNLMAPLVDSGLYMVDLQFSDGSSIYLKALLQ